MTTPAARAERWRSLHPPLPEGAPAVLEDLLCELERWNRRIKLTAPGSRAELAVRLIDDSLLLAAHVVGHTLVDVGSGPGIPGLPLAIALPAVEIRTVEPIAKKVAFTRAFLARHPTLRVHAFHGRAEGKPSEPWAPADTVLSRAFTAPEAWVKAGAPLVAPGGRLLVTLGAGTGEEADPVARSLGLVPAGLWIGRLGDAPRAIRRYDRPA